jgi:hypothetical protein
MATKRTRAYRGGSRRTSGSGALLDTVKNTFSQLTGNRARSSRGGSNLAAQASGFIGGLLSGGDSGRSSRGNRNRGQRRRR